ncbi:hypothetical protein AB0V93_33300, partial [Mesorhizobium ciceri]
MSQTNTAKKLDGLNQDVEFDTVEAQAEEVLEEVEEAVQQQAATSKASDATQLYLSEIGFSP